MSAAFFIVLDQEDPGFDTMVNGKFLSQDAKRARRRSPSRSASAPLEEYVSYSPERSSGDDGGNGNRSWTRSRALELARAEMVRPTRGAGLGE